MTKTPTKENQVRHAQKQRQTQGLGNTCSAKEAQRERIRQIQNKHAESDIQTHKLRYRNIQILAGTRKHNQRV